MTTKSINIKTKSTISTDKYDKLVVDIKPDSKSPSPRFDTTKKTKTKPKLKLKLKSQSISKLNKKTKLITISIDDKKLKKLSKISSKRTSADESLFFMSFNLGIFPPWIQFTFLASICFFGFWMCGYVEESIFGEHRFKSGWFLATFELSFFLIITTCANLWTYIPVIYNIIKKSIATRESVNSQSLISMIKNRFSPRSPMYIHLIIGIAMTFARSLTLFSLVYLNYPTQVIFKSMKLIFVLIGSYYCFGKKYKLLEVIGHILMVIAAILFSLGDHESQIVNFSDHIFGVIIVISSLIADSIHSNFQEYALRVNRSTFSELMIYSNGIAAILSCIACIVSKEIWLVIEFINSNPQIWGLFVIRSISIYIGAVAYLAVTKRFGAVIASEVTTARKVLTIITSYYLFPKPFIKKHSIGSVAFALAILMSVYAKRKQPTIKPKH